MALLEETIKQLREIGYSDDELRSGWRRIFKPQFSKDPEAPTLSNWPYANMMEEKRVDRDYTVDRNLDALFRDLEKFGYTDDDIIDAIIVEVPNISPVITVPAKQSPVKMGFQDDLIDGVVKIISYQSGPYAECTFDDWTYYAPTWTGTTMQHVKDKAHEHVMKEHSP